MTRFALSRPHRVNLLSALTATGALTYGSAPPPPPPPAPSGAISGPTLTAAVGGSHRWAIGHAFRQGDLPSGSGLAGLQTSVITTWPDGSTKTAIVAGQTSFTAGVATAVAMTIGTAASGSTLTTADLQAAMTQPATIGAGAIGSASWSGTDWLSPFAEVCTGPVMSSWVYRKVVGTDPTLVGWLEVRLFAGGAVEVLPWVENGYITGPVVANKSDTYTFTLGGSLRFNQAIDVKHRTRVPLLSGTAMTYWVGTDPGIVPRHNTAYLQRTGLVPTYWFTSPTSGTLNGLQQTYTPNTLAGINSGMGVAGSSAALIHRTGALYITSGGDPRAYAALQVFGYSGGSWSVHYRDPFTNYPFRFADHPSSSLQFSSPGVVGSTGGQNGTAVLTHQPSYGYLPALLTGRWWFMEESNFWTCFNYISCRINSRRGETSYENGPYLFASGSAGVIDVRNATTANRGAHWGIRTLAQTLAVMPNSHPNRADLLAAWESNVEFYYRTYVAGTHAPGWVSPQGFLGDYSSTNNSAYGVDGVSWWGAGWMSAFGVQAWGWSYDLGLPQSASYLTKHGQVRDQAYKQVTSRSGTDYNWRRFGIFSYPIGSDGTGLPPDTWYTAAQSYSAYLSGFGLTTISATVGSTLKVHSSDTDMFDGSTTASDYLPMSLSGLAYAFNHNAPGAMDGWHRITSASNFSALVGINQNPEHGIGPQLPSWVPEPGTFANLGTSTLASVKPTGWPTSGDIAGPFANWSGGFYARNIGNRGAYVVHGSGHLSAGTPLWAGTWCFDLESQVWVGRNVPAAPLLEGPDYNAFGESTVPATLGHAYAQHAYDGLVYQPAANGGGTSGSMWRIQAAGQTFTHKWDLSSATAPPTRPFSAQPGGNGYAMAALDEGRNGIWTLNNNGNSGLYFIDFATESATFFGGGYNTYGDNSLIYLPPPYDALVGMGRANAANTQWKYYVCHLGAGATTFTEITANVSGTAPNDPRSGGCWSTILNCIVSYQAGGSYAVHKLTPPAVGSNLTTAAWAWTSETLTGAGGATPAQCQVSTNGAWSRMVEIPWARCFIWADSVNQPTQAWRLTGM